MGLMEQFQQGGQISALRSILQGDTTAMVDQLTRVNPEFAQFVEQNRNKSPQQAFRDYGYDFSQVSSLINRS